MRSVFGDDTVFALNSALMFAGTFPGEMGEWVVWLYGNPKLARDNGVCVMAVP